MDLIYATPDRVDVGAMKDYEFDLAYGSDENDFELKTTLNNHVCREDYILYIEGTEYGGIIDSVAPNTSSNSLSYKGRTWHGVLDSKVISPDKGHDYLTYNEMDAHDVLRDLIQRLDLANLFEVEEGECGIEINGYQFRYTQAYEGICDMLSSVNAKLLLTWKEQKVMLCVKLINNYAIDEEFDSSQIGLRLQKNYNNCNHLVCLGTGDLKDRHVIHLFTNENGEVQPYTKTDDPKQDSDYILDTRNQLLFGNEEIVEIYDYNSAQDVENYLQLSDKPSDWDANYTNYYKRSDEAVTDEGVEKTAYTQLERNLQTVYNLLFSQPYDWNTNYKDYFYRQTDSLGNYVYDSDGNIQYENVASVSEEVYTLLLAKPQDWNTNYFDYYYLSKVEGGRQTWSSVGSVTKKKYEKQLYQPYDWNTNYASYFQYWSDGLTWEYRSVQGVSKERYVLQKRKPSGWNATWKDYYCLYMNNKYVKCSDVKLYKKKAPTWRKNTFYTKETYYIAPTWGKVSRYTEYEYETYPDWNTYASDQTSGQYSSYAKKTINTVPSWEAEKYYKAQENVDVGIIFLPNVYYKKVIDHFKELVEYGIKKLQEYYSSDEIEVSLDPTQQYDIGDMIGAYEHITDIFITQPISKKIVTIKKNLETIEYEVKKNGS